MEGQLEAVVRLVVVHSAATMVVAKAEMTAEGARVAVLAVVMVVVALVGEMEAVARVEALVGG